MGNDQGRGKKRLYRTRTVRRASLAFVLLFASACAPHQTAFRMGALEGPALPGSDIDPNVLERPELPAPRGEAPATETAPPAARDTNVPPEGDEQVPAGGPKSENVTQSLETAPYPPDRDESQLDQIRTRATPGEIFDDIGRPRRDYSKRLKERFGDRLNQPVTQDKISAEELAKSQKIFREIQRAVDRNRGLQDESLMFMASAEAVEKSKNFESTGELNRAGAWTIATEGTAKRHGFGNVPCAEFMSEVIRQAYARAGYDLAADFNAKDGNTLIWTETASVTGLSKALFKAGWVPYSAHHFRPPVGAIMFHTLGLSPSHTYAAAGLDGLLIVDNGAPKGRDLRQTKVKTLNLMFHSGFFMLPPGITPYRWPDPQTPTS